MKTLLVAINAKYPHTNPAVRSIAAFARLRGIDNVSFVEYTVNQQPDRILALLYAQAADVYLFSCYIWNIELVKLLAAELRKIRPDARLLAGGPEVSFHSRAFLADNPAFDLIVRGEGEPVVAQLLPLLKSGASLSDCPNITWRDKGGNITEQPEGEPPLMDSLPFPYEDLDTLTGRVIYYESMRGCPFRCAYCLSGGSSSVRYRSLEQVFHHLNRLLQAKVPRVKLVDRTFNCDAGRALAIWRYLSEHDNGVTNFHFELSAELLDQASLEFLAAVRRGLFQFEIGVQSTNFETLNAIRRPSRITELFRIVKQLQSPGNIHLHLDLIAGLPFENFSSFQRSFDQVYRLRPAQLQLGFLKVLRGSAMEVEKESFGLLYRQHAPYEVLTTRWLGYGELLRLKAVEEMLELFYNSGRFSRLMEALAAYFAHPFGCYEALAAFWNQKGYADKPPDKLGQFEFLGDFMQDRGIPQSEEHQWLCRFDLALREKIKRPPSWVTVDGTAGCRRLVSSILKDQNMLQSLFPSHPNPVDALKRAHLERFPSWLAACPGQSAVLLFDYAVRDVLGGARVVTLPGDLIASC